MAEFHPSAVLLPAAITLIAGYFLCTALYNVYFHPLAKFPGPRLYAASQIPITTNRLLGDEVMTFHKLHAKYGHFVRVAPGELSTINPAASKDVYGHRNPAKSIPKDFIANCVFGNSLHLLEKMEYNPFLANISAVVKFSAMRRAIRSFPFMDTAVENLIPAHMKRKRMEHAQFCDKLVDRQLEKAVTNHSDFWTLVLQANEKGEGLTLGEMHQNSFLFLTAATETTSSLMSALTYLLCQNPDKMKKLVDEVRGRFQSTEEMNTITLPALEYLQMCIEEGLRVYPPVPGGLPRRVADEGASLDGHELPPDV